MFVDVVVLAVDSEWCRDTEREASDFRAFIRTAKRLARILQPSNPLSVYAKDTFWYTTR